MLRIQSSEVGMLAGYAPFKPALESAERFWKRNRPDRFHLYLEKHGVPEWYEQEHFVNTNRHARSLLKEKGNTNTENTGDIKNVLESVSRDERTQSFTEKQKQFLDNEAKSMVFRRHGTKKESVTLSDWCSANGKEAIKLEKTFKLEIHPEVCIFGKIDGITSDQELVEIKNRSGGRLFNTIKDYEMAQCQSYLRMLDLQKGYLVECLRTEEGPVVSHNALERDDAFWEDCCEKILENIFSPRFTMMR